MRHSAARGNGRRRPFPRAAPFPCRQHVRVRRIGRALAPIAARAASPIHGFPSLRQPARCPVRSSLFVHAWPAAPAAPLGARGQQAPHGIAQAAAASRGVALTQHRASAVAIKNHAIPHGYLPIQRPKFVISSSDERRYAPAPQGCWWVHLRPRDITWLRLRLRPSNAIADARERCVVLQARSRSMSRHWANMHISR